MKKIMLFLVIVCFTVGFVFAQDYIVESINGRVQKESGNRRVNVTVGEKLTSETVIYTGIGASIVLRQDDKTITIPAANSGKIGDLTASPPRVRVSGNVVTTDTTAATRNLNQITTASARASDAAADEDISQENAE